MIFIYNKKSSNGARHLARKLQELNHAAKRVKRLNFIANPTDMVVAWGSAVAGTNLACKTLNWAPPFSKLTELICLHNEGVPSVPYSLTPMPGWMPRTKDHVGGHDFMDPENVVGDYWVQKLNLVREWRVHVFKHGEEFEVLRRAEKVKMDEDLPEGWGSPHPWVRSHEWGWKLSYNNSPLPKGVRTLARRAVEVLSLNFGAVDVAQDAEGHLLVLEVNRAPGLDDEGQTLLRYAQHIVREV